MILFRRKSNKHSWEQAPDHNYTQQEVGWEYRYFYDPTGNEAEELNEQIFSAIVRIASLKDRGGVDSRGEIAVNIARLALVDHHERKD
jgi:hypothetical protein